MSDDQKTMNFTVKIDDDFDYKKNNDIDRARQALKERYSQSDYEELIEFAAKYFVSDQRRKIEMDNFHQAMLGIEFAKADKNKEAQKRVEETYKNNSLFEAVKHVNFYEGKFRSWGMNARRHASDRKAKELVLSWWQEDKEKSSNKDKMVEVYQKKLREIGLQPTCNTKSKTEKREKDEEESYSYETIFRWLAKK